MCGWTAADGVAVWPFFPRAGRFFFSRAPQNTAPLLLCDVRGAASGAVAAFLLARCRWPRPVGFSS